MSDYQTRVDQLGIDAQVARTGRSTRVPFAVYGRKTRQGQQVEVQARSLQDGYALLLTGPDLELLLQRLEKGG